MLEAKEDTLLEKQIMTQRPVSVKVVNTHIADGKTTYVVYSMRVDFDGNYMWYIRRRFSEFVKLRNLLLVDVTDLPDLPKTWIPRVGGGNQRFLEGRQLYLNNFLRGVISNEILINHPAFLQFIGVCDSPEGSTGGAYRLGPTEKLHLLRHEFRNMTDPLFGVNSFVHDKENQQIVTISQDVWAVSRVDSMICNFRLPWEKPNTGIIPLGTVNLWKWIDSEEDTGIWECISVQYFKNTVSSLTFIPERQHVAVGLSDGRIFILDSSQKLKVLEKWTHHKGDVSGIVYIPEKDLIISCSHDASLKVMQCNGGKLEMWDETDFILTCMVCDDTNKRFFVGTKTGHILIYELKENKLFWAHKMGGHNGAVECLYYQEKENYLYSGCAGNKIGIWYINPQNIPRSRSQGWLNGPNSKRITSILYLPSQYQLLAGLDNGNLAVWDLSPTRPTNADKLIFVLKNMHSYAIKMIALEKEKDGASSSIRTCSEDGRVRLWIWPG